jgi:hypothetical protein
MVWNDNDLIRLFLPVINAGLIADGFSGVTVMQSNQPTQQGITVAPLVYFFKVFNKRYGWLAHYDEWNGSEMVHTEAQYFEVTWQVSALVLQNVQTPSYTASDLVNEVACIMQSDKTRDILNANGIGILRIMDIVNPYFVDDRDNFEAAPSFDFVLTGQNFRTSTNPVVSEFNGNIIGV